MQIYSDNLQRCSSKIDIYRLIVNTQSKKNSYSLFEAHIANEYQLQIYQNLWLSFLRSAEYKHDNRPTQFCFVKFQTNTIKQPIS